VTRLGSPPYICLITEGRLDPENYKSRSLATLETLSESASDGVNLVQIREKGLGGRLLFDLTRRAVETLSQEDVRILVNDRADIAWAAGAHGVHLPASGLSPLTIRSNFPDLLVGVSTHTLEEARTAVENGADYILFGPIFATPGKGESLGLPQLRRVSNELGDFPTIALGGVNEANCEDTIDAGAAGIAAIRALNEVSSRRDICRRLRVLIR
jgi:thiamine-phosphate pyrophosphorylase